MTDNFDELNDRFKKSAEDFSLIPSTGIWKNVERDIRKRERKRRFIIFFFLFAGLLIGGSVLYFNNSTNRNVQTASQKDNSVSTVPSPTKENNANENNISATKNNSVAPTSPIQNNSVEKIEITKPIQQTNVPVKSSPTKNVVASATTSITNQNNLASNNPIQTEITTNITPIISQVVTDSIKTTDSLQTETKKDSLLSAKADTIKKDTLIAMKDTIKPAPHNSKWSIAIGIAPTKNYTKLQEEGDYQFISHYRDSTDKNLLTWNYYLNINYKIFPVLEIYSGIGLLNFEQELLNRQVAYKYDTVIIGTLPNPVIVINKDNFNINGDSTGTVKNKFSYLEIPIGIRYNICPVSKFNIWLQPEISFNKLIHSEGYAYNYTTRQYEKINSANLQSWIVSYGIGLSLQYEIFKNVNLELTPYYRSFQKSIYDSAYPFSQKFQQVELRFSLRYFLK